MDSQLYQSRFKKAVNDAINRRSFLGMAGATGLGLAGCAANGAKITTVRPGSGKTQQARDNSTVSVVNTKDRRQGTYDSLKPFQNEVRQAIGNKQVIIKVNAGFPTEGHRVHSTYPDQVRGIMDFLNEFYDGPILISEGVGSSKTGDMMDGYELYGFTPLPREFKNITLVDANLTPLVTKYIHQFRQAPEPINIIRMYFDPNNYIISAARMKTHNAVVATYSLKNIVMGSPVGQANGRRSEKGKMHGGRGGGEGTGGQELSYNLFRLAVEGVYPDLAVVDGITAIEGDGPWDGEIVEHEVAVASTDFVACDRICTELDGIDPFIMKYLEFCGTTGLGNWDREKIRTVGADPAALKIDYKLHQNVEHQVGWIHEHFERT